MKDFLLNSMNELKALLYGLFVYLNIETEPVTILSILMIIDTILGATKVLRIDYTKFRFKELISGFISKVAFLILPMSVALIGKGLHYDLTILVVIFIKILIVSEGISILGNAISIRTKQEVEDYDIITRFLKKLRSLLINLGGNILKYLKNNNKEE